MCGIAGLFHLSGVVVQEEICAVQRMSQAQFHRGPDDSGFWHGSRAVLGHRRLSIIDLSTAGRQPLASEDGNVRIVCNGEIYNYRSLRAELCGHGHQFTSKSDGEVLAHGYEQWGIEGLLRRLRGMFAFAIYDHKKERMILARDRLGIKPLYFWSSPRGDVLVFASEVKAIVASGIVTEEPDRQGLAGFLLFGSVPSPRTVVKGIDCLCQGTTFAAAEDGESQSADIGTGTRQVISNWVRHSMLQSAFIWRATSQ